MKLYNPNQRNYFYLFGVLLIVLAIALYSNKKNIMDIPAMIAYLQNKPRPPDRPQFVTDTPSGQIVLTDRIGDTFIITHAVKTLGFERDHFSYGIGKNTIHPINEPKFISSKESSTIYPTPDKIFVVGIIVGKEKRAYPVRLISLHGLVNESYPTKLLAITYSPSFDIPLVYDRETVSKDTITFAPAGWGYKSNFIFYDHQSNSLWYPEKDGLLAIEGKMKGQKLPLYPGEITTLSDWLKKYPDSKILIS